MGEFALLLKPGGLLYLGLPIASTNKTTVGQRFYDERRFAELTQGWTLLATIWSPCCPLMTRGQLQRKNLSVTHRWQGATFWPHANAVLHATRDQWNWKHQPVFVLRPTVAALPEALDRINRARLCT